MSDDITDILSDGIQALEQIVLGESAKLGQQQASNLLSKYGKIREELLAVSAAATDSLPRLTQIFIESHSRFDPGWEVFDVTKSDLDDVELFKFISTVGGAILQYMQSSIARLHCLASNGSDFLPIFSGGKLSYGDLTRAEVAGERFLDAARDEYEVSLGFNKMLAAIYLTTRKEYKKLRRKYLGESAKGADDHDPLEDDMLAQLFGARPQKKDQPTGPAIALLDDNCVLTQLLMDLADALPRYYEKVVPIIRKGRVTSETKLMRSLDDGEVEECASLLMKSAHPTYVEYAIYPDRILSKVMLALTSYHAEYGRVSTALRALMKKTDLVLSKREESMADPRSIARQYSKINFLAIRPLAEDVAPRTKIERDHATARTKLLEHLRETLFSLSEMERGRESVEQYAIERTREAIELRATMDEMLKSERQKTLSRDIRDDNEFYVSKTGAVGALTIEREPAPSIRYEDVIGESFIKAKAHIEEVVKIASHPRIMRISAPRGDVKSNLLLIGPFGCGKTEIARAVGGDRRIIGFSLRTADLLTTYMHESVKNITRMFDYAKEMRQKSRCTKPVGILIDEFDRLFTYGEGVNAAYDGLRMEGTLQEMMDGVIGYEGVFMIALTNSPKTVPDAILRRFKYVDVVGQLTREERVRLFKQFLGKGLPISPDISEQAHLKWAEMMDHAPGDVLGKVADEIHFKFMRDYVDGDPKRALALERLLSKRLKNKEIAEVDRDVVRKGLGKHGMIDERAVTTALEDVLRQPQVKMQIAKAKAVYRDAEEILNGLSTDRGLGFGAQVGRKNSTWDR